MKRLLIGIAICAALSSSFEIAQAKEYFVDSFDRLKTDEWLFVGKESIQLIDSKDPKHGQVMRLEPNGEVYALIKDSEKWGPVSIEGEVLFPDDDHNYMGVIYNYSDNGSRRDFGNIYIKGNDSYIVANPWRDSNASRLLYEEYHTPLKGDDAIRIGTWHKFKAEVMQNVCHFYVNDMTTPKVVFDLFERTSGMVGFKPRVVGSAAWIDNIRVNSIDKLSYQGKKIPNILYQPEMLLTDWQVIGPLARYDDSIEKLKNTADWKPFKTDARGAVITGRITEFRGDKSVAYFRTDVSSDKNKNAVLHITTIDELALFVNGKFWSYIYRDGYVSGENDWNAWFDFWKNPEHAGRKVEIPLKAGQNQIILRVRNGQYASGGFFARLESS